MCCFTQCCDSRCRQWLSTTSPAPAPLVTPTCSPPAARLLRLVPQQPAEPAHPLHLCARHLVDRAGCAQGGRRRRRRRNHALGRHCAAGTGLAAFGRLVAAASASAPASVIPPPCRLPALLPLQCGWPTRPPWVPATWASWPRACRAGLPAWRHACPTCASTPPPCWPPATRCTTLPWRRRRACPGQVGAAVRCPGRAGRGGGGGGGVAPQQDVLVEAGLLSLAPSPACCFTLRSLRGGAAVGPGQLVQGRVGGPLRRLGAGAWPAPALVAHADQRWPPDGGEAQARAARLVLPGGREAHRKEREAPLRWACAVERPSHAPAEPTRAPACRRPSYPP